MALALGISYETFTRLTPAKLKIFQKAHNIKKRIRDEENWLMGQYTLRAVLVAIDHALNGRKAKSKYFEEPVLWKFLDEAELTEEEKEKRAMEKELLAMEQWIANDKRRGLPETKIK